VLEAKRLERVDVVAQSMAGTIALELALGGDSRISQEEFSAAVVVLGNLSQDAPRTAAPAADQ